LEGEHRVGRREFLTALGGGIAAAALAHTVGSNAEASAAPTSDSKHLAWVWEFIEDGRPDEIRPLLATTGMGILLKTHDGSSWMGKWDRSYDAIHGPAHVSHIANYFEDAGGPFHAWCVVTGRDPYAEARMASEVISAGARSLTFDLEPKEGKYYWQAGTQEAIEFGTELRRLQPNAHFSVAPDPRPWQLKVVPIAEFAAFCNEIAPQTYWNVFDTEPNHRLLREFGFPTGPEGVTPEFMLDVTKSALAPLNRPIRPVGFGKADSASWQRFVSHSRYLGMSSVSVWRYGIANADVWPLLHQMAPATPTAREAVVQAPPKASPTPAANANSYSSRWSIFRRNLREPANSGRTLQPASTRR
jgi:hypothetical protein